MKGSNSDSTGWLNVKIVLSNQKVTDVQIVISSQFG